MGDGQLALAALAFERVCVLLFAVLLQQPLGQQRSIRYAAGLLIAAAILLVGPYIYTTPTQMWGLTCASFNCLAAWCVLHWAFVEDPQKVPTVLEVVLSPTRHALEGVIKVHQRWLGWQAKGSTAAVQAQQQQQQPSILTLVHDAVVTLIVVHVTYDVGMHLLCISSNGMCSAVSIPSWIGPGPALAAQAGSLSAQSAAGEASYLAKCAFAFPAGILLTQQIEVTYGTIRLGMLLAAAKWPVLGKWAAQMPVRALNWPVAAASVSELWGFRWHQMLRFYFEGLGSTMVNAIFPKGKAPSALRSSMRCVAAFAMSGVLHEYLIWAVFGMLSGWHMAFFMLNCAAALLENWVPALVAACTSTNQQLLGSPSNSKGDDSCTVTAHVTPKVPERDSKVTNNSNSLSSSKKDQSLNGYRMQALLPMWLKHSLTLSFFIALSPLFIEPYRAAGFFHDRAFHPFGALVTPRVLGWIRDAAGIVVM